MDNVFVVSLGSYDFFFKDGNDAITFANRCKRTVIVGRRFHSTSPNIIVEVLTQKEYDERYPVEDFTKLEEE